MNNFLKSWNFLRTLRLVIGVAILVYGYTEMDWLLMMIGTTFGAMAIANTSCGPFAKDCKVEYSEKDRHEPT